MKLRKAFMNNKKSMRKNKKGGIEGLPLQLLIIIVVASLGLTMMVGWMNNIEEPATIDRVEVYADPVDSNYANEFELTFVVYDNKGNPVEDANIAITGLGITTDKPKTTGNWFTDHIVDPIKGFFGFGDDEESTPQYVEPPVPPADVTVIDKPEIVEPETEIVEPEVEQPIITVEPEIEVDVEEEIEDSEVAEVYEHKFNVLGAPVGGTVVTSTGGDGYSELTVYLSGLKGYGYLDVEVSKPGYGTYKTQVMVSA